VRSLRQAWEAAVAGVPLNAAAQQQAQAGDVSLLHAVQTFGKGA
jgi:ribulose-bisphosphate carboxylase large chain